MISYELFYSI